MSPLAHVCVHSSQFPESVRRELLASLAKRQINHKFLYESPAQAQNWLALHRAYAPSERDAGCRKVYAAAYRALVEAAESARLQMVGLCCGDGAKEASILRLLANRSRQVHYVPCDSSLPLILSAWTKTQGLSLLGCQPLVCDVQKATDLPLVFDRFRPSDCSSRVVTFFGALHNYPPNRIISRLASILRSGDLLLLSANLVQEGSYRQAVENVCSQYSNPLTHHWLSSVLSNLGLPLDVGRIQTMVEPCPFGTGLLRLAVYLTFSKPVQLTVAERSFRFRPGAQLRLFFSYRYTPERLQKLLARQGLQILQQWLAASDQEGLFLCRKGKGLVP